MADLVTFSADVGRRLLRMLTQFERRLDDTPNRRKRRPIDDGAGVPSCTRVRFQILVADSATRSALCHIMARPYGCGLTDIPGTVLDGYGIEVCDPSGCFFNETADALTGREGWAEYVMPISGGSFCQEGSPYLEPEWEVFSLCCAVFSCDL